MDNTIIDIISSGFFEKLILAIMGVTLPTIFGIIGWSFRIYYDAKKASKVKLYYPLYISCSGILDVIEKYNEYGKEQVKNLFKSCSKILDDITYTYGTIIYFKNDEHFRKFLRMKQLFDQYLLITQTKHWNYVTDKFEKDTEFGEMEQHAKDLLDVCVKKI